MKTHVGPCEPVDLKKVEGDNLQTHKDREVGKKLPKMNIRDGSLKANIEGKVKGQDEENGI
jgi:hypothetical protein